VLILGARGRGIAARARRGARAHRRHPCGCRGRDRQGRGVSRRSHCRVPRQSNSDQPASQQSQAEYSLTESKVAIINGGLAGEGLFKGRQTNLSYVPEQHTDFIFTVVGKSSASSAAHADRALRLLVWRMWRTARVSSDFFRHAARDRRGRDLRVQVFENIGMTMGIMPITGIPLPFMSYGGSAIIASFIAVGLVRQRQYAKVFITPAAATTGARCASRAQQKIPPIRRPAVDDLPAFARERLSK